MAIKLGRQMIHQTRRDMSERALGQALAILGNNAEKNTQHLIKAMDHITSEEKHAIMRDWIHTWMEEGKPGREFLGRILKNVHPNVRRKYLARMAVSLFFRDRESIDRCVEKYGFQPPSVMLISPSMRCNYRCKGCYAASYERKDDMKKEVFDRALYEAEEMGIRFFIILGGEPFIYPELLSVIEKHNKSFFQIYTNGSLLDKNVVNKLVELGNIAPQLSVNGPGKYTDASRGKGAFAQVMEAMDNLREAGCVFGFSSLVTRNNIDVICSEEWIDRLIEKGALYGWLFLYMPVGDNPDMQLMPTAEQRNDMRIAMRNFRQTKPILPADFWNDGVLTGGCIAGGRQYFHINHRGDVEPCIFCHFATHNINECSLSDALKSPFFTAIRENQPFCYNTLRPCPMIDHPQTMWGIIQKCGAKSTHAGAEKMFTEFASEMKSYADRVEEIMDDAWEKEGYQDWAPQWALMCRADPEIVEARRNSYQSSRTK